MAFLDNSGDIILDAVLTDTGRQLLAKGDGSFRVARFALGDDEINYALYDKNNENGTAFYDVDIMNTPVFEAFTNNIASLNSRLISFSKNNLLYLPVLKTNYKQTPFATTDLVKDGFVLAVDSDTEQLLNTIAKKDGILNGFNYISAKFIRVDQGVDNNNYPPAAGLEPDLKETQYLFEIDNRLGSIVPNNLNTIPEPSSIDDDDMASYYFSLGDGFQIVSENPYAANDTTQVLLGAHGTKVEFKVKSSMEVSTSDYLFNQLGTDITSLSVFNGSGATNVRSILSSVRITGLTTGYAIDVPILVVKKIA